MHTPTKLSSHEILGRMAMPLLLFLSILTALLALSWLLLLPRWTKIPVGGDLLSPSEADAYVHTLESELALEEASRLNHVIPAEDPVYAALAEERRNLPGLLELRDEVLQAARRSSPDAPDAIAIDRFALDGAAGRVTIAGEVGGVGPRSITILAHFVDVLQELSFVQEVIPPSFTRVDDPKTGPFSPFEITLVL